MESTGLPSASYDLVAVQVGAAAAGGCCCWVLGGAAGRGVLLLLLSALLLGGGTVVKSFGWRTGREAAVLGVAV